MESPRQASSPRRRAAFAVVALTVALAGAGCGALGYTSGKANRQNGRNIFINGKNGKPGCGSCHTLADAGTTGTIGPDLDVAFAQDLKVGMTEGTIRQVVRGQIAFAITNTSTGAPGMPKNLVTGNDARDVAAYVAAAVDKDTAGGTATPAAPAPTRTPTPSPTPTPAPTGKGTTSGGNTADGKKVFLGAGGCGACHTLKDAGTTGTVGPKLDNVAADAQKANKGPLAAYVKQSIEDPGAYVVPGFPNGVMPPNFKQTLTAQQITDLVAYILSVAGK